MKFFKAFMRGVSLPSAEKQAVSSVAIAPRRMRPGGGIPGVKGRKKSHLYVKKKKERKKRRSQIVARDLFLQQSRRAAEEVNFPLM